MTYTPKRAFQNNTKETDIEEHEWAYLKRTEKPVSKLKKFMISLLVNFCYTIKMDPDTGEPSDELAYVVEDTPLLVNIKGW